MSGVLNDCDALLQGAAVRIVNPKNASIILSTDAPAFHVNSSGVADVNTIKVTATLYDLDGPLTFSAQGATLTNVTDRSATVTYANMQGPTAIVTASMVRGGVMFSQSCIIATTQDGASGAPAKVLILSPTEQVFKIDKAGANTPASITLTATGQNLVGTPSFTIPVGTATLSAGANASQKVLSFANMATDSVTVQVTLDGLTDRVTIIKVREGIDGADGITALLTNESVTLPASSSGVVSSYSGAVCSMKVYKGTTDDTANWSFATAPASSTGNLTYTRTGETITVTGMASGVDAAYVDITASRAGYPSITKRFNVSKSRAGDSVSGARGAGMYFAEGSTWSDAAADGATPAGNVVGDVVTISNGSTYSMTKKWDGSAWVVMGAVFDGSLFVTGSINGAALKAGTVEIRDSQGNLILGAGKALAQQIRMSPNLVPNVRSWKYATLGASAYGDSANTANGEYINLPATAGAVYLETDIVVPSAGGTFTLSCLANALTAGADFAISIVGNPSVNLQPIYSALTTTQQRFTATFTIPANTSGLRIRAYTTSAKGAQIADVKLETGSNATAWSSDVITAGNASTFIQAGAFGTLSAYAAYIGSMEIGAGGNIRQGMTDYGVGIGMWFGQHQGINKFIIGNPNASMMWWDGSQLQTQNLSLINPSFGTFTASLSGAGITSSGPNETRALGSRQIIGSGGKLPYRSFSWTVTDLEGNSAASTVISGETTDTVSVTARGTNAVTRVRITGTITDANGLTASASFISNATFGTP